MKSKVRAINNIQEKTKMITKRRQKPFILIPFLKESRVQITIANMNMSEIFRFTINLGS